MRQKSETRGGTPGRIVKDIRRTVRVSDEKVQIIGDKSSLVAVISGQQSAAGEISGFVRKGRTRQDSNSPDRIDGAVDYWRVSVVRN